MSNPSRTLSIISSVIVGFGSLLPGQPTDRHNELTPEEVRAGWVLLFDGKTARGWSSPSSEQFPNGFWRIEDGFLRGAAVGARGIDLQSTEKFRNFELQFEWKIELGGNSGLKYLVGSSQKLVFEGNGLPQREGTTQPGPNAIFREGTYGMEYQMVDEAEHPDGKSPLTISGALYQFAGLERSHARPAGQLNRSKIVVNGSRIEHWLNGTRVVAVDTASEEFRSTASKAPGRTRRALDYLSQEGPIAIQSHTGAVWIRNIKLRRLKPLP
ncbi:MAG: DUF1080 domain-containing protein [Bryobacterales bacterium]|nr:DUF1080 domain-containing protein [Bryobacterales bacterium]